jgi:hypothetical protein
MVDLLNKGINLSNLNIADRIELAIPRVSLFCPAASSATITPHEDR